MGKRNGRQHRMEYDLLAPTDTETNAKLAKADQPPRVPAQEAFKSIGHRKKRKFLEAYVLTGGNATRSSLLAGCSNSMPHYWEKNDPEFRELYNLARGMANEALEAEAIRRGFEGYLAPVGWHRGKPGALVRQYSDTLLIFLLKGAFPDKYAERQEVKGQFAHIDWSQLPDEALSRIANGEHPTSVIASLAARYEVQQALPAGPAEPAEPAAKPAELAEDPKTPRQD